MTFSLLQHLAHLGAGLREAWDLALIAAGAVLVVVSYTPSALAGPAAAVLASPVGALARKAVRVAGLVLMLAGGCRVYVTQQIATRDTALALAVAQAEQAALLRGAAQAAEQAAEQAARERATTRVKTVIIHEGTPPGCRDIPALRTAADELRRRHGTGQNPAAR